ncbi:cobalamin B12-binding domain-containing protein [Bacilliculturomica massiliensis]|uniref:cobalamin B12-binding domain-containing protein n=1 Tax=Bacilliculturomica massiliensis TaxID=1917867 RepID=UPI00103096AA|nr:corrinoid protein [Bacilliculturomica massiliensis]
MDILKQISQYVVEGEPGELEELMRRALDQGSTARELLDGGLLDGMNQVGELFREGEMFVPEVLMSARTMDLGMEIIKPLLGEGDVKVAGKIVVATVKGDLHDIGKKLVCMMLEGAGYEIHDLGVDVSPEDICRAVEEIRPDLVGMSAMLTTTMTAMKETTEALRAAGLYDSVKVMVGGAPINAGFAEEIGANYSPDATGAVELANALMAS